MFFQPGKLAITCFLLLLFSMARSQAVIEVMGNIGDDNTDLVGVLVQVSQGGKVVYTTKTDPNGDYTLRIPLGGDFLVEASREGYVSKKFAINTIGVPNESPDQKYKPIGASINLFRKLEGVDYSLLNQPMMKYRYNREDETMEFDKNHQAMMAEGIAKIREAEKEIKKQEREREARYGQFLKEGDKAFNRKDYAASISNYQEALKLRPKENYPQAQIDNIKKLQAEAEALARQDADAKSKADADAAAKKAAEDAANKAKLDAEARARAQAEKEQADKLAKEKADADAKAKSEADARAKAAADALAKKQAEEAAAKAKLEAEALARTQAEKERTERLAKEKADADAKAKAEAEQRQKEAADALAKKQAKEQEEKQKAEAEALAKAKADKEKADKIAQEKLAREEKQKAEAEALAKKKADEDAAAKAAEAEKQRVATEAALKAEKERNEKLAKEKAIADEKLNAENAEREKLAAEKKAKADKEDAERKKAADELAAKLKAEKDQADKVAAEKAAADAKTLADAKKKNEEQALAKQKADEEQRLKNEKLIAEALAKEKEQARLREEAEEKKRAEAERLAREKVMADASKNKDKNILPTLQSNDDPRYRESIRKADNFFALQRYQDAKKAYEEALVYKGGDTYAKERLLECEKKLQSDASQVKDERQRQLLAKYPPGITEETIPGEGVVIIKRILVKDRVAYVYEKKIFNWGGIAFFRDGNPITEPVFEQETRK